MRLCPFLILTFLVLSFSDSSTEQAPTTAEQSEVKTLGLKDLGRLFPHWSTFESTAQKTK